MGAGRERFSLGRQAVLELQARGATGNHAAFGRLSFIEAEQALPASRPADISDHARALS